MAAMSVSALTYFFTDKPKSINQGENRYNSKHVELFATVATATATRTTKKLNRLRLTKQQLCTCSKIFCTFVCSDCTTTI